MAKQNASNIVTRAERMSLACSANVQIQGLSAQLLRMVQGQNIDSDAARHHAALGMLAKIYDLSDDVFMLIHGDPADEITREQARDIVYKLGIERIDAEAGHG